MYIEFKINIQTHNISSHSTTSLPHQYITVESEFIQFVMFILKNDDDDKFLFFEYPNEQTEAGYLKVGWLLLLLFRLKIER
jgi:hypothetical protein